MPQVKLFKHVRAVRLFKFIPFAKETLLRVNFETIQSVGANKLILYERASIL